MGNAISDTNFGVVDFIRIGDTTPIRKSVRGMFQNMMIANMTNSRVELL